MKLLRYSILWLLSVTLAPADEAGLEVIKAIGTEGKGNVEAAEAWKTLSMSGPEAIPGILAAAHDAGPVATNYLRSAVETIVDRTVARGGEVRVAGLGEFLLDTRQNPRARRYAFELIQRVDPETAAKLVPGMLADPSVDLRRDAVARLIEEGQALVTAEKKGAASVLLRQALNAARDVDQIKVIAKTLRELGGQVDLPEHFGFLMRWRVIGPFDNTGLTGFETVYPPESELNFDAEYDAKGGEEKAKWSDFQTADEFGMVDVNKAFGPLKEVTAYAYTEFDSAGVRPVELRLGCKNAWKIWLNGELLFGRDEYHRGMSIDQYQLPAQLKEGKNTILVKLCQNEQTEQWTVEWQFQLRVCDATGTAVLAANRLPTPTESTQLTGGAAERRRPKARQ